MIQKWDTISKSELGDFKIFRAELIRRKHPLRNKESDFVILNSNNWANVVPVTKDNKILLIEQYRQGSDSITIEIPGGLVEIDELPIDAAKRECIEETGFSSSENLILIGECLPNPAFLNNHCYSYAWFGLEKLYDQNLDENEDIRVVKADYETVKEMIRTGKINHSIIVTALHYFFEYYKKD